MDLEGTMISFPIGYSLGSIVIIKGTREIRKELVFYKERRPLVTMVKIKKVSIRVPLQGKF